MKRPIIFLFLACLSLSAFAQSNCEDAAEIIRLAERDLANRTYERAINRLLDARDNCAAKKEQVNRLIKKAFQQIEGEKRSAQQAQKETQQEKQRADSSLLVANKVLSQLYFYNDRFGLTLKDVRKEFDDPLKYRYGYIDRKGNPLIAFEFEEATPFSNLDGFARVKKEGQKYLLDTTGVIYRLAESLAELDEQTEALDLHENLTEGIPSNIGSYPKLRALLLYQTGDKQGPIKSLPASFSLLSQLRHLDLRNNQLTSLEASFGNLKQLQNLNLNNNQLTDLPEEFGELKQLRSLDLSNNKLIGLPERFGDLGQLQSLNLGFNQLKNLPLSFPQLSQLQRLDLSANPLISLPKSFGNLTELRSLELIANQLTDLPDSFGNLSQLHSLYLGGNELNALPNSFGNLGQLEELNLIACPLLSLPESFGNLSKLKRLDISITELTSLDASFGSLSQLQILYLPQNQLKSLPEEICDIKDLKIREFPNYPFGIEENPLLELPDCWLEKHSEQDLVDFASLCISDSLYHVSWQTLDNLQQRFPERFALEKKRFEDLVGKLEVENEDLDKIRVMLN